MRWDIDKALRELEADTCKGTSITRGMVAAKDLEALYKEKHGLTLRKTDGDFIYLWCLGLGLSYEPKAFFYGRTIREAYLKARKVIKKGKLADFTPWGHQPTFQPKVRRRARRRDDPRARKKAPAKQAD